MELNGPMRTFCKMLLCCVLHVLWHSVITIVRSGDIIKVTFSGSECNDVNLNVNVNLTVKFRVHINRTFRISN